MVNEESSSGDRPKQVERETIEKKWIGGIKKGDKAAFKAMFDAYYDGLARFAYRYVHSKSIAKELVQNLFLWIWENRSEWVVRGALKPYLFRGIKNNAIDYWRKKRTREQYIKAYQTEYEELKTNIEASEAAGAGKFMKAAQEAIEDLPEQGRMIYKLSRLEGLTYKEIAHVLEISPKTVETHMSRSLKFLRKQLSHFLPVLIAAGCLEFLV